MTDANIIPVFHILYDNTHCQSVSVASEATVANNVCFTLSYSNPFGCCKPQVYSQDCIRYCRVIRHSPIDPLEAVCCNRKGFIDSDALSFDVRTYSEDWS